MNILIKYVEEGDRRRNEFAYTLINLYDYARMGQMDLSNSLTDIEKDNWRKKADEYRDEIAQYIMKGLK